MMKDLFSDLQQSPCGNRSDELSRIDFLRRELHRHNHNYYVLSQPEISDFEFDKLMRELTELEQKHPEYYDANSPSVRDRDGK